MRDAWLALSKRPLDRKINRTLGETLTPICTDDTDQEQSLRV